jgi:peptidyl-prolyl cis-trans isomerase SurA
MILQQNKMSLDQLESELKRTQGIGIAKFKARLRKSIREKLIKDKLFQKYMSNSAISRKDVETFFEQYKDSLPTLGESVLISQLTIAIAPSDSMRQRAYAAISKLRERLTRGEDFADLARKNSEDPSAENGGFIEKGTLSELEFEQRAFALKIGEISEPFETRLGFHVITVIAKKEQKVHLRQIVIKVAPDSIRTARIIARLDSIRQACKNNADFAAAVKALSTDPRQIARSGRMGWVIVADLPDSLRALPQGAVSQIVKDKAAFSLYRADQRVLSRTLTLADDSGILTEKAREIYSQKKLIDLVKKWRQEVFVAIRPFS